MTESELNTFLEIEWDFGWRLLPSEDAYDLLERQSGYLDDFLEVFDLESYIESIKTIEDLETFRRIQSAFLEAKKMRYDESINPDNNAKISDICKLLENDKDYFILLESEDKDIILPRTILHTLSLLDSDYAFTFDKVELLDKQQFDELTLKEKLFLRMLKDKIVKHAAGPTLNKTQKDTDEYKN